MSQNRSHHDAYHGGILVCGEQGDGRHPAQCIRALVSSVLGAATVVLCLYKLVLFGRAHLTPITYYMVTGVAMCEALILTLKWGFVAKALWLHFMAIYLHVVQFLLVCLFYGGLALKRIGKRHLIPRVLYPIAATMFLYFTFILLWSLTTPKKADQKECTALHWILFSSSEVGMSIILILAGGYLDRAIAKLAKVNRVLATWKRRTLWSLIAAYTTHGVVAFAFDLLFVLQPNGDCDKVFGDSSSAGYTAYSLTDRLTFLLAIWVLMKSWKAGPRRVSLADDNERAHQFSQARSSMFSTNSDREQSDSSLLDFADATE